MKISLVLLALLVLQISDVFGSTFGQTISTDKVYGRTVKYCEYNQLKLLPKSVFNDYEACVHCYCGKGRLSCGSLSFTAHVPDDSLCISVTIGCKNVWVFRDNKNKHCPKKLRPKNFSMVGK